VIENEMVSVTEEKGLEAVDMKELLQFQGTLVDLVIFENSLWWQRQGVFLIFNSIFATVIWSLFPALTVFHSTPLLWNVFATAVTVLIVIFCLCVSVFWLATIQTANKWRNFYVTLAKNLEEKMQTATEYKIWSGKPIEAVNLKFLGISGSSWGRLIPVSFFIFWIIIGVIFICLYSVPLIP
jgi:hypothetical protein